MVNDSQETREKEQDLTCNEGNQTWTITGCLLHHPNHWAPHLLHFKDDMDNIYASWSAGVALLPNYSILLVAKLTQLRP